MPGYLKLRFGESRRARGRRVVRLHDDPDERRKHVRHGRGDEGRARLGYHFQHLRLVNRGRSLCHLGGLRSAIFNEVLQFVLIWGGALLVPILGMIQAGGWHDLKTKILANWQGQDYTHMWRGTGHFPPTPWAFTGPELSLAWAS